MLTQRDAMLFIATNLLLACGGSSVEHLGRDGTSGSGGTELGGHAGELHAAAGTAVIGGRGNGGTSSANAGTTARGGASGGVAGATGKPALGGGGQGAHGGAAGRSGAGGASGGVAGNGGAPARGGTENGGAATGGNGRGGLGQGGRSAGGGVGRGGRGAGGGPTGGLPGIGGAAGQTSCNESLATYCGVGGAASGGAAGTTCVLDWTSAKDPSYWCGKALRILIYDCSDGQAVVEGGVDTATIFHYDPQSETLIEVDEDGIGATRCVAGPAEQLYTTLPSCTASTPCAAGAGGL